MLTAFILGSLDQPGHYIHKGWLQVSVANAVVILIMILLFVLALLLPFPKGKDEQ